MAATLEQRLLEQPQNGLTPPVQCINLMEGPTIEPLLDVDQSMAPSDLSNLNPLTRPTDYDRPSDTKTPKPLESPTNFYISDLLRADL